jgi:regulator of replication initiation timing
MNANENLRAQKSERKRLIALQAEVERLRERVSYLEGVRRHLEVDNDELRGRLQDLEG